jgi:hypothetical protein
MKKLILFIGFLFLLSGIIYAQNLSKKEVCPPISTFPYMEGFENNEGNFPECWTQEQVGGSTPWVITTNSGNPSTAHGGTYKAKLTDGDMTLPNKAKLITPPFDLTSLGAPALSFWFVNRLVSYFSNQLTVYYKTSLGGEWVILKEYANENYDWTNDIIPLPNPSNDYYIAFEGTSISPNLDVSLDDILIFDDVCAETIVQFPYLEGFEDNGGNFPECWKQELYNGYTVWSVIDNPSLAHEGDRLAFFFDYNSKAKLITPPFDLTVLSNPVLSFWFSQQDNGFGHANLRVFYKTLVNSEWILLKEYLNAVDEWSNDTIVLPNPSKDYYIAFESESIDGYYEVKIDDITISGSEIFIDPSLESILTPPAGDYYDLNSTQPVTVEIFSGSSPLSEFDMLLECNGKIIATETYSEPPIPAMELKEYTFTATIDLSKTGDYEIKVTLLVPDDPVPDNNSKTINVHVCGNSVFPWGEDFEIDGFTIYPNPTKDLLKIIRTSGGTAQIEIYSSVGTMVKSLKINDNEVDMNLYELPKGVYWVRLTDGVNMVARAFVKE